MSHKADLRFGLPLDTAQNPYLDERRNYDPNLPKRKPRSIASKTNAPVIAVTTKGTKETESPQHDSKDDQRSKQEVSTPSNAKVQKSPKGNFKAKQRADQEKRWQKLQSLNEDLLKQRGKTAKLNKPDETLFHINAVRLDGQRADSTYEHAHRMDWGDRRWIKALNRWRSRRLYFWIGPAAPRTRAAREGIPFTGAEKDFLRSFTGVYRGEWIPREDWVVITAFFNGQVVGGRERSAKQLQDLRCTLDIEDVEG